jgi:hypothetical protein
MKIIYHYYYIHIANLSNKQQLQETIKTRRIEKRESKLITCYCNNEMNIFSFSFFVDLKKEDEEILDLTKFTISKLKLLLLFFFFFWFISFEHDILYYFK